MVCTYILGGGLGRDGGGISEPITARTIFGREGLGATGVGKNFKQKINKIIQVPLRYLRKNKVVQAPFFYIFSIFLLLSTMFNPVLETRI